MTAPWTRQEASASGQVFEFRLWALLVEQSRGGLHVFLPLADRGIDALVHRLSDGTYFRVQARGRSSLVGCEVQLSRFLRTCRASLKFATKATNWTTRRRSSS